LGTLFEVMAPQFTTARYAAVISTVALFVSFGSLYLAKLSYDLSAAKDEREIRDRMPAIDVQIRPAGVATASVTISIINRAEINILPQDVTAEPSLQAGEFYFSSAQQGIDKLKSSLSLLPMGTVVPKGVGTMKASLSGITDGKDDLFTPGVELQFAIRIRFADEQDTVRAFDIIRRVRRP
jgi:hypothetical protein